MGRALHQLRLAIGRGFDKPPDWSLCPPYEEESVCLLSPSRLPLSLDDTSENAINDYLRASGLARPRHCGMIIQAGSEVRILLAEEHPRSVLDGYAAAGRHAILHFVDDVRRFSVERTPYRPGMSAQSSIIWSPPDLRIVLEMSDQEFCHLIRNREIQHKNATAKSLIQLICEERCLGGALADYELSVVVATQTDQSAMNNTTAKEHFFWSEGDVLRYMNRHWADKSPVYRLWKRGGSDKDQQLVSSSQRLIQEAQPLQYRLTAASNIDVERHGMSHNRSYDAKGRPTASIGQQSREEFEDRLVIAQNSILMTGARRLGQANDQDELENKQVLDMPEDIESYQW